MRLSGTRISSWMKDFGTPRRWTRLEVMAAQSIPSVIRWGDCSGRGWTGKPYPRFRTVNILRREMTEIGGKVGPASREDCPNLSDCAYFSICRLGCDSQCSRHDLH